MMDCIRLGSSLPFFWGLVKPKLTPGGSPGIWDGLGMEKAGIWKGLSGWDDGIGAVCMGRVVGAGAGAAAVGGADVGAWQAQTFQ